mmetsp:Transcript_34899/g.67886  ORF Transcript_34899/g.67886 Transcript_34899/m.67886 type:complete len:220 (-) Transcript_34899:276-935(-)
MWLLDATHQSALHQPHRHALRLTPMHTPPRPHHPCQEINAVTRVRVLLHRSPTTLTNLGLEDVALEEEEVAHGYLFSAEPHAEGYRLRDEEVFPRLGLHSLAFDALQLIARHDALLCRQTMSSNHSHVLIQSQPIGFPAHPHLKRRHIFLGEFREWRFACARHLRRVEDKWDLIRIRKRHHIILLLFPFRGFGASSSLALGQDPVVSFARVCFRVIVCV